MKIAIPLGRMNIFGRILAGFLAVMAVLGTALWWAVDTARVNMTGTQSLAAAEAEVSFLLETQRDLLKLRNASLTYVTYGADNAADEAYGLIDGMKKGLASAAGDPGFADHKDKIAAWKAGIERYAAALKEADGLIGARDKRLRGPARKAETDAPVLFDAVEQGAIDDEDIATQTKTGYVRNDYLNVRLDAAALFKSPSARNRAALEKSLERLQNDIRGLLTDAKGARRDPIEKMLAVVGTYRQNVLDAAGDAIKIEELSAKTMASELRTLLADLDTLAKATRAQSEQRAGETLATAERSIRIAIGAAIAAGLIGLALASLIARGIVCPIRGLTRVMTGLAAGEDTLDVPSRTRRDEIGAMARAVEIFKQTSQEKRRMEAEQAEQEQETAARAATERNAMADALESSVMGIVASVQRAASELETSARALSDGADRTLKTVGEVSGVSYSMAGKVQTVASAAVELNASIAEITRQVESSSQRTDTAVREARSATETMRGLADAAGRIEGVIGLINKIAGQTNLLALNATIEAARAGEAGKGFAVVATEVKHLASQTADATREIAEQIQGIQSATANAVGAIDGIGRTVGEIAQIAAAIAAAVREQDEVTSEIARSADAAAGDTTTVTGSIGHVEAAAVDGQAATGQVLGAASRLSQQAEALRTDVNGFIHRIRA
jgi:methyl-accepting chemotaxis protein